MKWAVAVTTVSTRLHHLCAATLSSLHEAGFVEPLLATDIHSNAMAHWATTLVKLYIYNPKCDRYAIFQDDLKAVRCLRQYLNQVPESTMQGNYLNLYTAPENEYKLAGRDLKQRVREGWHESNQLGKGALGLVFSRDIVVKLLCTDTFWLKHQSDRVPHKNIDGCVVTALRKHGIKELVHWPSLLQHTGSGSSAIGNRARELSNSWPGVEWIPSGFIDVKEQVHAESSNGR